MEDERASTEVFQPEGATAPDEPAAAAVYPADVGSGPLSIENLATARGLTGQIGTTQDIGSGCRVAIFPWGVALESGGHTVLLSGEVF